MPKADVKDVRAVAKRLSQALAASKPKLTKSQLAAKLKVTPGAISHWFNGNRPCPDDVIIKIAKITKVEPGWLLHGTNISRATSQPSSAARSRVRHLTWGFREAPADGGKDFGNAAVYATPMAIKTVVREDGQNSLDAARAGDVVLRFRLVELSPDCKRYARVLDALEFRHLRDRIHAIEEANDYESKLGTKLSAGLESVLSEKLILLYVDDYHTHGLQGGEFDSTKPYSALVRDNLNSRKDAQTAGGVFGVGSKVNIACSRLSTVLFSSKVEGEEKKGTRLVGRTELTYHEIGERNRSERFAGPGWFGETSGSSAVVQSAWLPDDDRILDDLMLRRDRLPREVRSADSTGTSIMIIGFTDPQTEAGASTQQLADSFVEAAAVNFWPAMMKGALTVIVERYVDDSPEPVKSERVDPREVAGVAELCDAWEKSVAGETTPALLNPGDVASIEIPLTVPPTRPRARGVRQHDELQAECRLLVRLANPDDGDSDPRLGQVAYTRGRAMVVRYQPRAGVVGGRPFHATLLAGTLVGRSPEQVAAEQFLRIAEPPAHDRWTFNPDLGERYARGAKKALDEFHARVTEALQRVLRPASARVGDGPESLKRLLQIRSPKTEAPKHPQARILRGNAKIVDGAWVVDAEVTINPTPRKLILTPRLSFRCEGGPAIPVRWTRVEASDDFAVDGFSLVLPPRTKRLSLRAWSDPESHPVDAHESSASLDISVRAEADRE